MDQIIGRPGWVTWDHFTVYTGLSDVAYLNFVGETSWSPHNKVYWIHELCSSLVAGTCLRDHFLIELGI